MTWWFPVKLFPDPNGDFSLPARHARRYRSSSDEFVADGRPPPRYRGSLPPQRVSSYIEEDAYNSETSEYDVEERSRPLPRHRLVQPSRRSTPLTGTVPPPPPLYNVPSPDPYLPIPPPAPRPRLPSPIDAQAPIVRPRPRRRSTTSSSSGGAMPPHVPDPPPRPSTPMGHPNGPSQDTRHQFTRDDIIPTVIPGLSSYPGSGSTSGSGSGSASGSSRRGHRHRRHHRSSRTAHSD